MPKIEPTTGKVKPYTSKISTQKTNSSLVPTEALKAQTVKFAQNLKESSLAMGKGIAQGSVVLGQGLLKGSQIVGQGTVAALKGTKTGVQKGISGFQKFLNYSVEKLHLKKPDLEPLEQLEKEITPFLPTEAAKRWAWKNIKLKPTMSKGNLVLKWSRVFCWHEDPFKPEMLYPLDEFFVLDKEKKSALNRFLVKGESYGTITGEEGAGKSMFLHWIRWELETHHPELVPCLLDCSDKKVSDAMLIKQLMLPFLNMYQKTVSRPFEEMKPEALAQYIKKKVGQKPFVLLIDEPENIPEKGYDLFALLQKGGLRMHIIVAGEKEELKKSLFGKGMKDSLKFELTGVTTDGAAQLLKKRIEAVGGQGTYPFDHQIVKMLCDHAKGNPLKLLELAKEKVIQLSIDHQEEIVSQQQEIIHAQEEALRKKVIEERQRHVQEREKLHRQREDERKRHVQALEQQRIEEEKRAVAEIAKEDMQLDKIDELIGTIVGTGEKEEKGKKAGKVTDEVKKQEALISQAIGNAPEQKSVSKVLEEDSSLAKELEQVFAETEKAQKGHKDFAKKKR